MKCTLIAIALAATASAACTSALAQDTLEPVIVERDNGYRIVEDCTPPNDSPRCTAFHQLIRQNFREREIGMLFGAATAYPEYRVSYNSVRERYDLLLQNVADNGFPVAVVGARW